MRIRHSLAGLALVLGGSLVARPAASRAKSKPDEVAAVRAARLAQNAAIATGDLARVASFWTADVSIRAGLGRALSGRDAYLAAFVADSDMRYRRIPTEITVSTHWPLAYESGTWTGYLAHSRASGAPLLRGRYSAQWVKSGSRWLIRSEVFVALDCAGPACDWPAAVP